jgi:hypothetical protein
VHLKYVNRTTVLYVHRRFWALGLINLTEVSVVSLCHSSHMLMCIQNKTTVTSFSNPSIPQFIFILSYVPVFITYTQKFSVPNLRS